MQKLTKEQALIVTGYTGFACCNIGDFQKDVERRLGMSTWTHQFTDPDFVKMVKELYRADFIAICAE